MARGGKYQPVYSTQTGRLCPDCGRPAAHCICTGKKAVGKERDGIVRIRRETAGRKGKTVTTLSGVPTNIVSVDALAQELKRHCGTGGSVKDGIIIIQGDHREKIKALLEKRGFAVKLAGG